MLALRRMKALPPSSVRRLFEATVTPVVDYASTVWMHSVGVSALARLNQIQRLGGQAVVGAFRSTSRAVAEAEANIRPMAVRLWEHAASFWVDVRSLPDNHPLSRLDIRSYNRYPSPLHKIRELLPKQMAINIEKIHPYVVSGSPLGNSSAVQKTCRGRGSGRTIRTPHRDGKHPGCDSGGE